MIDISKETAVVFPGQGSQVIGMGSDLYEKSSIAKDIFDEVDDTLGRKLTDIIFSGSQETLNKTENAQPAITATSLACFSVFNEKYKNFKPSVTAGHSLGEYTSLSAANALSISDTIRLVSERGRLMQIACDKNPGGMVAIIGMEIDVVEEVCREAGAYPSNVNSSQQVIISGDNDGVISCPIPDIISNSEFLTKEDISSPSSGRTKTSSSPWITKHGKSTNFKASLRSPKE